MTLDSGHLRSASVTEPAGHGLLPQRDLNWAGAFRSHNKVIMLYQHSPAQSLQTLVGMWVFRNVLAFWISSRSLKLEVEEQSPGGSSAGSHILTCFQDLPSRLALTLCHDQYHRAGEPPTCSEDLNPPRLPIMEIKRREGVGGRLTDIWAKPSFIIRPSQQPCAGVTIIMPILQIRKVKTSGSQVCHPRSQHNL